MNEDEEIKQKYENFKDYKEHEKTKIILFQKIVSYFLYFVFFFT